MQQLIVAFLLISFYNVEFQYECSECKKVKKTFSCLKCMKLYCFDCCEHVPSLEWCEKHAPFLCSVCSVDKSAEAKQIEDHSIFLKHPVKRISDPTKAFVEDWVRKRNKDDNSPDPSESIKKFNVLGETILGNKQLTSTSLKRLRDVAFTEFRSEDRSNFRKLLKVLSQAEFNREICREYLAPSLHFLLK